MSVNVIVDQDILLEKFPGKGGWTFARIPDFTKNGKRPFGWRKVKGSIDHYQLHNYHLMPMGHGQLFLPVKAEIRKFIRKEAGDMVRVILYPEEEMDSIPEELIDCLKDEPAAWNAFQLLDTAAKMELVRSVYSRPESERVQRITKLIDLLRHSYKKSK